MFQRGDYSLLRDEDFADRSGSMLDCSLFFTDSGAVYYSIMENGDLSLRSPC